MINENKSQLKELVRSKYSDIAFRSNAGQSVSCCEPAGCCGPAGKSSQKQDSYISVMSESYEALEGYQPDADLHLGCGIPVKYAGLKPGQSVLDLGSGAGNDLFVARSIVGDGGRLTGLDFSETMVQKARLNVQKMGYNNMEFVLGDIEEMPFEDNRFDVILSNCVLNLVPDKKRAFAEMHRVLKAGGHFSISDIVLEGDIPEQIKKATEAYVGCVSGAIGKSEYLHIVEDAGFFDLSIQKTQKINIPTEWFSQMKGYQDTTDFQSDALMVLSITLTGRKIS